MEVITQLRLLAGLAIPKQLFGEINLNAEQKLDAGFVAGEFFGNPIKTVAMFRKGDCLLTERNSLVDVRLIVCSTVQQREPCVQMQDGIVVVDSSHPL